MSKQEIELEKKLIRIIKEDKTKIITINKQKYYISRPKLNELKTLINRNEKEGGFFPLILAALGALGALAGGAAGVAGTVLSNNREKEKNEEQARHNQAIENQLSGSGLEISSPLLPLITKVLSNLPPMHTKLLKGTLKHISPFVNVTQTSDGSGLLLYPQLLEALYSLF